MPAHDAELLVHLSIFGFARLSASDQLEKNEEIRNVLFPSVVTVDEQLSEEIEEDFRLRTFTELLKKLPFPERSLFVCSLLKKFKHERQRRFEELISSSKQLSTRDEEQKIKTTVDDTAADKDTDFAEFFFGFSKIWFEGQSADGQNELIRQASAILGVEGVAVIDLDSIRVTRFTELCKKLAIQFGTQARFLEIVDQKIRQGASLPQELLLASQDAEAAAADLVLSETKGERPLRSNRTLEHPLLMLKSGLLQKCTSDSETQSKRNEFIKVKTLNLKEGGSTTNQGGGGGGVEGVGR